LPCHDIHEKKEVSSSLHDVSDNARDSFAGNEPFSALHDVIENSEVSSFQHVFENTGDSSYKSAQWQARPTFAIQKLGGFPFSPRSYASDVRRVRSSA